MATSSYPVPKGLYALPEHLLDLRPDDEVDQDLVNPKPVTNEKNVWFFWHSGYTSMHPYTKRNVRAWHRRFSKKGWAIRVIDQEPSSALNVANYLDVNDSKTFPRAFREKKIEGTYWAQHCSDLVRWPLLLKYGGVYADTGLLQIGDLDLFWNETVGNPSSPYDVISYNSGVLVDRSLTNYFMGSGKNNPFFERCHRLLLALWAEDGGKNSTAGMHGSMLLQGVPKMGGSEVPSFEDDSGRTIHSEEAKGMISDYMIQGQAMSMVMGLVDAGDNWNGPDYVEKHVYSVEFNEGSQLVAMFTQWSAQRAFDLLSLPLPKEGESESPDQMAAREVIEGCLQRSFGWKLAHGIIVKVMRGTLGSLWLKNEGADNVPGTYAHWLRHAIVHWNKDTLPPRYKVKDISPYKVGSLLGEA